MATFVGAATDGSGDPTPAVPAGTQDGDVMIAALFHSGDSSSVHAPAGWTEIGTAVTQSALAATMFYRVASSEPGSYTWEIDGSVGPTGAGHFVFRGIDAPGGDPISVFGKGSGENNNLVSAPQVTTPGVNSVLTFVAAYRFGTTDLVHFDSADAGTEAADWGDESNSSTDYTFSGGFYYRLDVDPGTHGYHVDLSGSNVTAAVSWTVALNGSGMAGDVAATAPAATVAAGGSVVIPGGEMTAAAPATFLSIAGVANLARGDIAATAPTPFASMLSASKIEGGPNAVAPAARASFAAHRDMFATITMQAPTPRFLSGAETRIFGARVVVVRPESRVRYPY